MDKFKQYMIALRPWSFSASLTPVLVGSALAYNELTREHNTFKASIFILSLIIALCVHGAGNLVNTYYDYKNGVDSAEKQKGSSDRTLVDRLLKPEELTRFGVALYLCASFSFMIMVFLSPAKDEILAFIYFGGLSLSFMYTGGIGFKYIALGDLIIIITFGPITILFAYISQVGSVTNDELFFYKLFLKPLLYAIPLVLNTEAILHSNNARDLEDDKKSGIVTLAMYLGFTGSYILYVLFIFVPYMMFLVMSLKYSSFYYLPIVTIKMAFDLEENFRSHQLADLPMKTAHLNLIFGILYVIAIFFSNS